MRSNCQFPVYNRLILLFISVENLLILFELVMVNSAVGVISKRTEVKRGKIANGVNVKNYCTISDKNGLDIEDPDQRDLIQINCSLVPGPVRKLHLMSDNYFRLDSSHYVAPSEFCVLKR